MLSGPNACYFSKFLGGAHQIDVGMFVVMRKWIIVYKTFTGMIGEEIKSGDYFCTDEGLQNTILLAYCGSL